MSEKKSKKGTWVQAFGSLGFSIFLILSVRWLFIEPYVIPSGSMKPSLLVNDYIFVNKLAYGLRLPFSSSWLWYHDSPERGEVVVFRSVNDPNLFMVKRIIGLPGDHIAMSDRGELKINSQSVSREMIESGEDHTVFRETLEGREFYTRSLTKKESDSFKEFEVPDGEIFLMGDNRDHSHDSRFWGSLPLENLLGRASFIWFSCDSEDTQALVSCSPQQVRWGRVLKSVD